MRHPVTSRPSRPPSRRRKKALAKWWGVLFILPLPACSTTPIASSSRAARCDGHTRPRRPRRHEHRPSNRHERPRRRSRPACGSRRGMENARAASGPTRPSPARVSHTAWTARRAAHTLHRHSRRYLEHHVTSRISTIRRDPDRRNLSPHRRYAPTSVHLQRIRRSPSVEYAASSARAAGCPCTRRPNVRSVSISRAEARKRGAACTCSRRDRAGSCTRTRFAMSSGDSFTPWASPSPTTRPSRGSMICASTSPTRP